MNPPIGQNRVGSKQPVWPRVFLVAAAVALLAACGGEAGTLPPMLLGPTTIVFFPSMSALSYDPQPYLGLAEQVKPFEEAHPDIHVDLLLPDYSTFTRTVTIEDIAEQSDCFVWGTDIQSPANVEVVIDIGPLLDAEPSLEDDFYPSLLDQFTYRGRLWALPARALPYVIKYNRDLFDAAGVGYPAPEWTTDDFFAAAVALTRGSGEAKQYGFVPSYDEMAELVMMLERRGADLIDESADPPTAASSAPATVEALRWYAALTTEYGAKPVFITDWTKLDELSTAYEERETLIRTGRAAMWLPAEGWEFFSDGYEFSVGVAPLPAGVNVAAGAYRSAEGYFISARAEASQVRACWKWVTTLSGQPGAVWGVPARRSVVNSDAYRQKVGAERAVVYEVSVDGPARSPAFLGNAYQPWMVGAIFWLSRAYGQVVEGEPSPEEALDTAQRTFDDYRACIIAREAFLDVEGIKTCLAEADPTLYDLLMSMGDD